MNIPVKITFHSVEHRDKWLLSEGIRPVGFAFSGQPIRFLSERYTLQAPYNELRTVHGEMTLKNPA